MLYCKKFETQIPLISFGSFAISTCFEKKNLAIDDQINPCIAFFLPSTATSLKQDPKQSRISGFEALLRKSPLKNTETRERALRLLQKLQSNEQVMGAPTQAHER